MFSIGYLTQLNAQHSVDAPGQLALTPRQDESPGQLRLHASPTDDPETYPQLSQVPAVDVAVGTAVGPAVGASVGVGGLLTAPLVGVGAGVDVGVSFAAGVALGAE